MNPRGTRRRSPPVGRRTGDHCAPRPPTRCAGTPKGTRSVHPRHGADHPTVHRSAGPTTPSRGRWTTPDGRSDHPARSRSTDSDVRRPRTNHPGCDRTGGPQSFPGPGGRGHTAAGPRIRSGAGGTTRCPIGARRSGHPRRNGPPDRGAPRRRPGHAAGVGLHSSTRPHRSARSRYPSGRRRCRRPGWSCVGDGPNPARPGPRPSGFRCGVAPSRRRPGPSSAAGVLHHRRPGCSRRPGGRSSRLSGVRRRSGAPNCGRAGDARGTQPSPHSTWAPPPTGGPS